MDERITLAHGAGGRQTAELIDKVFRAHLGSEHLTADDAAVIDMPSSGRQAISTDGFIVSPWRFKGGDIGKLAVCGTVNDLASMGAKPMYMTAAFIIEEGFAAADLEEIAASMRRTADAAGITVVAGDTKVAGKGQADGVFITATGVGLISPGVHTSGSLAADGDAVIVTGDIGRHGCTILLARTDLGIDADVDSDCAPLWDTVEDVLSVCPDVHVIRDATRGGVGTVLYEIASQSGKGIVLDRDSIPVDGRVQGVCDLLGLDPLYLACEGRMVIIAPHERADAVVDVLRRHCPHASVIGHVTSSDPGRVIMTTPLGTGALLPYPRGELLPRIC
ncbi:MAG: hydrogenase expression/formation protein HypE [Oscillospiraceae bacterium]|nr:hydrogenase expression/formation protein HypE [Oscillospiraceae bacterium]